MTVWYIFGSPYQSSMTNEEDMCEHNRPWANWVFVPIDLPNNIPICMGMSAMNHRSLPLAFYSPPWHKSRFPKIKYRLCNPQKACHNTELSSPYNTCCHTHDMPRCSSPSTVWHGQTLSMISPCPLDERRSSFLAIELRKLTVEHHGNLYSLEKNYHVSLTVIVKPLNKCQPQILLMIWI